jgi:hypothetical protein
MAVSKSVEMTTMGKQYDTRTECPIPESRTVRPNRIFPRIFPRVFVPGDAADASV